MRVRQLGSTGLPICFFMADSTDHITGLTGLSPAVEISKNGGAFASPVGAIAEIGYGWYALAGNANDLNTLGTLLIHAEAEGADPFDMDITIDSYLGHLTNLTMPGWGAINWSYLLTEPPEGVGAPIADAKIWVCSDSAGTNIIASGVTNQNGLASFWLDAGTVYVFRKKAGRNFVNPDVEVVA